MRITSVNIPKESIENGLETVKMRKLGGVVLLTGKNGSGKTRLLDLIEKKLNLKPDNSTLKSAQINLKNRLEDKSQHQVELHQLYENSSHETDSLQIELIKNELSTTERQVKHYESIVNHYSFIQTSQSQNKYDIVRFFPKSLKLGDVQQYTKKQMQAYAEGVNKVGTDGLVLGTFSRIQVVQDNYYNATHPDINIPESEIEIATIEYEKLNLIIRTFLDTSIDRTPNGDATIFGLSLGEAKLSEGQTILIQLCLAIHSQEQSLDELILFMDEPENHLHPSILIQTIDKIISCIPNGQIWISTHSVPLLAHFDPSNIWFVDNNKVEYSGKGPEKVLESLLGDENRVQELMDFISLPSELALNRHAFESLFHSKSITTGKHDPQSLQINEEIRKILGEKEIIRVLDYGIGKGRLLSNIIDMNFDSAETLAVWFDFYGFDLFDSDKTTCLSVLDRLYNNPDERYFNDFAQLFEIKDQHSFDITVMCNVLHEINPIHWLNIFSTDGELSKVLSNNGILLLVEDQRMPIGEKAYENGFIVLDTDDLKVLFKIKEEDTAFTCNDARKDGRLKSHLIKKEYFTRIDSESRKAAILNLHQKAATKIKTIRQGNVDYKTGKLHGFWLQQYANSGLVLKEL